MRDALSAVRGSRDCGRGSVRFETVEEYLARGGTITRVAMFVSGNPRTMDEILYGDTAVSRAQLWRKGRISLLDKRTTAA